MTKIKSRPFVFLTVGLLWVGLGNKNVFLESVNYHKIVKYNLSKLIYTYLKVWIRFCVAKKNARKSGAESLRTAAEKLKEKLELILQGEAPYDIFVRWKPKALQPIGCEPDLNDGVRLNIRPCTP